MSRRPSRRLDFRTILLVATKELLESIRDRRTLFVALVLPVLIYPIVVLALGPVISMQKKELAETSQSVVLTGDDAAAVKMLVLDPPVPSDDGEARPPALEVVASDDPLRDLSDGKVQLWVDVPKGFAEALRREETGGIRVRYDASEDKSIEAWHKWRAAFEAAGRREMDARLVRKGLPEAWRNPLHQDLENVAPPERTAAFVFGRILAMLLVLMTLTSSFYPAVDAVAGEKERGTMETLLVAPCGRTELVLGKFGAILVVTLAAALLNLASLAFTSGPLLGAMGPERMPALQITWPVIAGILVLLVPLAALFSAVSLSLSTLARSVKEAQHYLSPLVMLVMPLAMVVILPNLPLTRTLAAVPVTNAVLFFRDLMLGRTEWGTTVIVMVSTFGFAALAIWASVLLFLREETLFRGPEGSGSPLRRPAPRAVPSASSGVFLFAASLAGLWYAQGALPKDIAANVLITQIAVVLAPCVLLSVWMRLDVTRTFRLATPPARTWIAVAAALPLGIALPILSSTIQRAVAGDPAPDGAMAQAEKQMRELVGSSPALPLALLLGVLPALCEELVFRGFVLSGFRQAWTTRRGGVAAILVTAVFFALSHVFPEKWANTFAIGVLLGWLALRTGSLLPGIIAHAVHNAATVVAVKYSDSGWARALYGGGQAPDGTEPGPGGAVAGDAVAGLGATRIAVAAAVTAVLLGVVFLATRRPRDDAVRGT